MRKTENYIHKFGSTRNGTISKCDFLAATKNQLYLCIAFGTQTRNIEY